jgi:hypothetical protein
MSLINHYKQPVVKKSVVVSGAATSLTVWTPASGKRIILEGLDVSPVGNTTTTIAFYFGGDAVLRGPTRIAMYALDTTSVIFPRFAGLEATADVVLQAVLGAATQVQVSAYGFELE